MELLKPMLKEITDAVKHNIIIRGQRDGKGKLEIQKELIKEVINTVFERKVPIEYRLQSLNLCFNITPPQLFSVFEHCNIIIIEFKIRAKYPCHN